LFADVVPIVITYAKFANNFMSKIFSTKNEGCLTVVPNSLDFSLLDYHLWGFILEAYHMLEQKPSMIRELQNKLQNIWNDLP